MFLDRVKSSLPLGFVTVGNVASFASSFLVLRKITSVSTAVLVSGVVAIATTFAAKKVSIWGTQAIASKQLPATTFVAKKISIWGTQAVASKQLAEIQKKILRCNATKALYEKARSAVDTAHCVELSINTKAGVEFGAMFSGDGAIYIDNRLSEAEMMQCVIFELANASQAEAVQAITNRLRAQVIARERFAAEIEEIEYGSALIFRDVIEAARKDSPEDWGKISTHGFDEIIQSPNAAAEFKLMKSHNPKHVNSYYEQWQDSMNCKGNSSDQDMNSEKARYRATQELNLALNKLTV